MTLSIIVPVYNVEEYIGPCLESIFRQGLRADEFEVIVVDDGTKDNSIDIVGAMATEHTNIVVVSQHNQGLSAARNTGMAHARGKYILFLDSDDLLVDNTLPRLLTEADGAQADMVVADFVKMTDEEIARQPRQRNDGQTYTSATMSGNQLFIHEFNTRECYVWRSIYRRAFLEENSLTFIKGIYFEDVPFTPECLLRAKTCVRARLTFYVYRQRKSSIVSTVNMRKLKDMNTAMAALRRTKATVCTNDEQRQKVDDTVFDTLSIAIWYIIHDKELVGKRREYIDDLRSKMPRLRFHGGMKQRIASAILAIMPRTYILAKHYLVTFKK